MTELKQIKKLKLLEREISLLKKTRELEQGRNDVLRMVAQGAELEHILDTLCHNTQRYNENILCSVLRFDAQHNTLHPIASASLPQYYCDALEGIQVGAGIGSCGTAAFTKKRVIVEDINTHPYWMQYKKLPLGAGLQACWSEPIIGGDNQLFGTFALYYSIPTSPTKEDIQFIEVCANLAAVVFENAETRKKLLDANYLLSQTIDQRNQELEQANLELSSTLAQQSELHQKSVNLEKVSTTKNLIIGFAHEINTPIGIALTAITTAENQFKQLSQLLHQGKISRNTVEKLSNSVTEAISLNQISLTRTAQLLSKFNEINFELDVALSSPFYLGEFFSKLKVNFRHQSDDFKIEIACEEIKVPHSESALWQIMCQLIENTFTHGFKEKPSGTISIVATLNENSLVITYQDNGCGISSIHKDMVFEPFYSTNRSGGHLGLGLNLVANILTTTFQGKIQLLPAPIGVRYEISIPVDITK
mgnify:CR=1 FL=1